MIYCADSFVESAQYLHKGLYEDKKPSRDKIEKTAALLVMAVILAGQIRFPAALYADEINEEVSSNETEKAAVSENTVSENAPEVISDNEIADGNYFCVESGHSSEEHPIEIILDNVN